MLRFLGWIFTFVFLGAVTAGLAFWVYISMPLNSAVGEVTIEVPPGPFSKVLDRLEETGLIKNKRMASRVAQFLGYTKTVKVGEYRVSGSNSLSEVYKTLASGKSVLYTVTIPEGKNLFEVADIFESAGFGPAKDFVKIFTDPSVATELTGFNVNTLEGYLFPETYTLSKFESKKAIVKSMVIQAQNAFKELSESARPPLNLDRQQIFTLASIIEKETGAPEERPTIASVFINRLKKKMRLQSDPTIIYGIWIQTGEPLRNIKKSHLSLPSPYNTYYVKGLPKGPIASPGKESLRAVFEPATTDYLYFVSRNDGTHEFTSTYAEHDKAVHKYQRTRANRVGKSWRDRK